MTEQTKLDKDDATPHDVYLDIVAHEASGYPKDRCIPCGGVIRMGFFFDAFGRNRDIDGPASSHYSNICRLWEAHRNNLDKSVRKPLRANQFWYRFYYAGLGTPLNKDAQSDEWKKAGGAALTLGAKAALGATKNVTESVARVKEPLDHADVPKQVKKAIKDSVEEFSFRPLVQAFGDIRSSIAEAPRSARRVMNVLSSSPERIWERTKAGGVALWRKEKDRWNWQLDWRNPIKAAQGAVRQVFTGLVVEHVPIVRDNALMAGAFGTGVTIRIDAAMSQFKDAVNDARAVMPNIKRIEVSVFGADRGCVLARAFVNKLSAEYKRKDDLDLAFGSIPIEIKFLGLLDAVSSIMSEEAGELIGMVPYLGSIKADYRDQPLAVPASVHHCVHFAAAHEMRFYQRLDSLEKTRGEQFLYPGTSSDVVGGAPTGSLGFNAELMRVPLRDMLLQALKAGAAMDTMEDLNRYKKKTFEKFTLATPIVDDGKEYRIKELVDAYRSIVPRTTGLDFLSHSKVFMRWIAVRYQSPAFRASVTSHFDALSAAHKKRLEERNNAQAAYDALRQQWPATDARALADAQARLDAATSAEMSALREASQEKARPVVSVWERIHQESEEILRRGAAESGLSHSAALVGEKAASGGLPRGTDARTVAAAIERERLSPDEAALAQAWTTGIKGADPLPPKVMALFDLLVHDTLLTSWHDHLLAPTLYFRTREKDVLGVTDYAAEDKQRQSDDLNAARAAALSEQSRAWADSYKSPALPQ